MFCLNSLWYRDPQLKTFLIEFETALVKSIVPDTKNFQFHRRAPKVVALGEG